MGRDMTEFIRIETSEHILRLTISRVDKRNALNDAMYAVLAGALENAEADPDVRVVLLCADGECFTAGNDLSDFAARDVSPENIFRFLHALAGATKPLVAAVQGKAVGIGTTLLLHCDFAVLAEDAELITPFVNLGLVPEAGSSLLLPSRIGYLRAYAMFALGEPVNAQQALAWGLANKIVPNAALMETALAVARRLSRQPPDALAATKKLMRQVGEISARIDLENELFLERLASAEAKEAFSAFFERRAPDFSKVS
jgi:enoyl-CoA hydratase/carnithine racemase